MLTSLQLFPFDLVRHDVIITCTMHHVYHTHACMWRHLFILACTRSYFVMDYYEPLHEGNSIIMRNGFHGDDAEEEIEVYVAAVDTLEPPGTFCMVTQSTSFHITGYVVGVRCALCGMRCVVWWCVRALV